MKRRLINLWIAASLTLAVVTAGLWVRSYWMIDRLNRSSDRLGYFELRSDAGLVGFFRMSWTEMSPVDRSLLRDGYSSRPTPAARDFLARLKGFYAIFPVKHLVVIFPHWLPVLLLSAPPGAVLFARWRRRRRAARAGRDAAAVPCPDCGYDTRATPGRCPECGKAIDLTVAVNERAT